MDRAGRAGVSLACVDQRHAGQVCEAFGLKNREMRLRRRVGEGWVGESERPTRLRVCCRIRLFSDRRCPDDSRAVRAALDAGKERNGGRIPLASPAEVNGPPGLG